MLKPRRDFQELLINDNQIAALEEFLIASANLKTDFAKKAVIWLLRQTNRLADEICVSFPKEIGDRAREVGFGIHDINSCNCSTQISLVLKAMGSHMIFESHCGGYVDDEFDAKAGGYTVWIARSYYDHGVPRLELDLEAIEAISLKRDPYNDEAEAKSA
jgi:hypothetical protein